MSALARAGGARRFLAGGAAAIALGCCGGGLYLEAKATLAQVLLARAWSATAGSRDRVRPWPWADTWPVAKLALPRLGASWIVLAGASGRTLAFGPGHLDGTALPGAPGHAVVAGHRDTQFAALRALRLGDRVVVETPTRRRVVYRVTATAVVDRGAGARPAPSAPDTLTLVTCWPFDAVVPGGPLRYVVRAERSDEAAAGPPAGEPGHGGAR